MTETDALMNRLLRQATLSEIDEAVAHDPQNESYESIYSLRVGVANGAYLASLSGEFEPERDALLERWQLARMGIFSVHGLPAAAQRACLELLIDDNQPFGRPTI